MTSNKIEIKLTPRHIPKPKITLKLSSKHVQSKNSSHVETKTKVKEPLKKPKITLKLAKSLLDNDYDDEEFDVHSISSEDFQITDDDIEYMNTIPPCEDGPPSQASLTSFLPLPEDLEAVTKITSTQQKALKHIVTKSEKLSKNAESKLLVKIKKLGYDETTLIHLQLYIRDRAPIIIHIKTMHIKLLLDKKDTHYRNLFEVTPPSSHTGRIAWENRMFDGIYDKSPPWERVKYGVLNIFNDPYGVLSCYGYGDCYLRLKKVRLRTTFSNCDTASSTAIVSCCEYYSHILNKYTNEELKDVIKIARKDIVNCSKKKILGPYREIQIHGDVILKEHVEALVVNPKYRKNMKLVEIFMNFGEYYQIPVIWMDEIV